MATHTPTSSTASPALRRPRAERVDHVVGEAAHAAPGTGPAIDNGGDWLSERTHAPRVDPAAGAPLAGSHSVSGNGHGSESKRGQQ